MRYELDASWQRFGSVLVAGSPLKIFRTTPAGERLLVELENDADVATSVLIDRLLDAGAVHPLPGLLDGPSHRYGLDDVTVVTPQLGGDLASAAGLVVDDGSPTPIAGAALRLETNRGPAAARNAARPLVTTPLVAFVDADVDLLGDVGIGDWLDDLLPHFDDRRVGLVAPRVCGEESSPIDLGTAAARIRAGTRVSYVPAAAIVVRVDAFDDVGGFDEQLRFGEDVDLVWRLDQAGWRCRYEPASMVWHEPRETVAGTMRQHAGYGSSAAPLALRHPDALSPIRTNGWTASAWCLLVTGHPLAAATIAVGSSAALIRKLPDVPPRWAFHLAMTGHLRAVQQIASAARRVWWPIVVVAAMCSKRARWGAVVAAAMGGRTLPNDVAYGWGVWKGMRRHRTLRPIMPDLTPWPGRRDSGRR